VEVLQDQQLGGIVRDDRAQRANGGERILGSWAAADGAVLKALFQVPGCQLPILLLAEAADLGQGVLMFVRFNPNAGEAGAHQLGQTLR
jgi:hypothetical protein